MRRRFSLYSVRLIDDASMEQRSSTLQFAGLCLGAAVFVVFLCGPSSARAEREAPLSELDFYGELPNLFSAARMPQALADAPGAVTIIDRELIRASGARDVPDLFRLVPGFNVGYASGGRPVVAYHGITGQLSQRMQVLLDGRPLHEPYVLDGINWNNIPVNLDDIERIEVFRGSNSASYGANAFLGVANIITRSAAQSAGGYVEVHAGSDRILDAAARIGSGNDGVNWRISAGHRQDDGLTGAFDDRRINYSSLLGEVQLNATDQLSLQLGIDSNELETGSKRTAGDPERTERTKAAFGLIRWQRTFDHDHEMSISYWATYEEGHDKFTIPIPFTDGLAVDYGRRAVRNQLEYQHFLGLNTELRMSWGAEIHDDSLKAPQYFNTTSSQNATAATAYLNAEWRPSPMWTFNVGGSVGYASTSGSYFAPRAVANWKFSPEQTVRLGYSTSYRTPSLFEQRSDWRFVYQGQTIDIRYLSRGGLQPEQVKVVDLSYLGDWHRSGLVVDARVFGERVTRIITQQLYSLPPGTEFDPKSGAYDLRNADSADLIGVEGQIRYRPTANQLLLIGGYLTRRDGSTSAITESIPGYGLHALGSVRFGSEHNFSLAYYRTAPIRWLGEPQRIGATNRLDAKLERTFNIGVNRASIAVVGQSLLGNTTDFRPSQQFSRRVWLTFALEH